MNRTTFQIYGATKGVVQSGLVINLDAGDPLSYPGTGILWTDLTGNGNNGTLVNGPTFNSANGGSVVFDGINDNVTFPYNISLTNKITVEVWVNLNSTAPPNNTGWILGRESSYRLIYANGSFTWVCATTSNSWYSAPTVVTASTPGATAGIFQVVGTCDGKRNRIYVNGVLKTTGGELNGNILNIVNAYNLFKTGATNVDYGKGKLYLHRFYNKALSEKEVSQNFYATKERFGL